MTYFIIIEWYDERIVYWLFAEKCFHGLYGYSMEVVLLVSISSSMVSGGAMTDWDVRGPAVLLLSSAVVLSFCALAWRHRSLWLSNNGMPCVVYTALSCERSSCRGLWKYSWGSSEKVNGKNYIIGWFRYEKNLWFVWYFTDAANI